MTAKNKKLVANISSLVSQIEYREVETSSGIFKVRGLNTDEITLLYVNSPEVLNFIIEDVKIKGFSAAQLSANIQQKIPTLGYLVLALVTDDEIEDAHLFGKLPIFDFVKLLENVIDLTTPSDVESAKKTLAMMNSMLMKQLSL